MGAVYVTTVGPIEESTDLWDLFQKDARAVYGLFPGQLWSELVERGPQFRDRVVEIIKRGLLSDDPEERRAAIEAVRLVPSPAYANALTQIAAKYQVPDAFRNVEALICQDQRLFSQAIANLMQDDILNNRFTNFH